MMPLDHNCTFVAAIFGHSTYLESGAITEYVPTKAACEGKFTLGTTSFVSVNQVMQSMGIEPTWN